MFNIIAFSSLFKPIAQIAKPYATTDTTNVITKRYWKFQNIETIKQIITQINAGINSDIKTSLINLVKSRFIL